MNPRAFITSPWLYIGIQTIVVLLIMGGAVERMPAALLVTLAVALDIALLPLEKALTLVIASIPLAIAVPIAPSFDTFANWRIFVAILFLSWVFRTKLWNTDIRQAIKNIVLYEWALVGILLFGALSLLIAQDPLAGARKLLFLINAGLLYVVVREEASRHARAVLEGVLASALFVFVFGAAQYLAVQFVSLYDFWQGWAGNVIPVFYGTELSELLAKSNTWFSFYETAPPTLRIFSVFPDSHSFALFSLMIFGVGALLLTQGKRTKGFALIGSVSLAIFLSGSRGAWMGALMPLAATMALAVPIFQKYLAKLLENYVHKEALLRTARIILIGWMLLLAAFPIASVLTAHARGAGVEAQEAKAAFRRARSIFDVGELSNRTRIAIWKESIQGVLTHPLLGVGLANFPQVLGEDVGAGRKGASAHNLYLDIAVEAGVMAGILALLFFIFSAWHAVRNNVLWFALIVLWIATYSLVDVVLLNDKVLLVFLSLAALFRSHTTQRIT